ncbi:MULTISPECIES: AAA family ATPase [unclassified Cyanobium]|uniref:AAA family ATPase n=1 Tax=unclassified Cyanobium TaxID=2627006 RepID=UPI0020CF4B35|nr:MULTISPECIES: AAA family ATPase [unclassified Cyanobium]MCP9859798.1 AAA family ATPase [Cyanobium sp. Cruz-8H5]MCP9866928.1 AAA family ATPase [Cyanobium sp. Cruz-8D1]
MASAEPAAPAQACIDHGAAEQFLSLLGKDPASARLRAFPHRANPAKGAIGARKGPFELAVAEQWQREGRGIYLVINDGGDRKSEITACRAFFVEWDDRPIAWQLNAWRELGLPEPSLIVLSGGKSAHCYWLLEQPIPPQEWAPLQAELIAYAGGDPHCKDASRVMRLPGCWYVDAAGEPTALVELVHVSGQRYAPEDIALALLPDEFAEPAAGPAPRHAIPLDEPSERPGTGIPLPNLDDEDFGPPRPLEQIRSALAAIPRRVAGSNTYADYRNLLWGLIQACEQAGHDRELAIALMEAHSPSVSCGWDIRQVASSGGEQISAATFWFHARQHGWLPPEPAHTPRPPGAQATGSRRNQGDTGGRHPGGKSADRTSSSNARGTKRAGPGAGPQRFSPRPDTRVRWGKVHLPIPKRLQALEHCIRSLAVRERNSLWRYARVREAHAALQLKTALRLQEIGQLTLEALDLRNGNRFHALTEDERAAMPPPAVQWEIPGCIPRRDLSIVGGRAKVGKTRLVHALARCLLCAEDFLGFGAPEEPRPVILVTDDQGDGDTAQMLQQLGIWDHPLLLWSRRFRATEANLDALLACLAEHPGAVVILDSLRSITRSCCFGENDPEMGSLIYDLKHQITDAGGTLLLIHHCNKANDTTGTEALSGHNAIAGAANTILTLHYLAKGNRLIKDSPQRRLVREARSGPPADLVVAIDGSSGAFARLGTYDDLQEQQEQESDLDRAAQRVRKASEKQKEALRYLQALHTNGLAGVGLLELLQSINAAPPEARLRRDLEGEALSIYTTLGRFLSKLDGLVTTTRVGTSGQSYYLRYGLSDAGAEWLAREFDL